MPFHVLLYDYESELAKKLYGDQLDIKECQASLTSQNSDLMDESPSYSPLSDIIDINPVLSFVPNNITISPIINHENQYDSYSHNMDPCWETYILKYILYLKIFFNFKVISLIKNRLDEKYTVLKDALSRTRYKTWNDNFEMVLGSDDDSYDKTNEDIIEHFNRTIVSISLDKEIRIFNEVESVVDSLILRVEYMLNYSEIKELSANRNDADFDAFMVKKKCLTNFLCNAENLTNSR